MASMQVSRSRPSDHELTSRLAANLRVLENATRQYARCRKDTVKLLRQLADQLCEQHEYARAAKVIGGVMGLVGAGMVIAGVCDRDLRDLVRPGAAIGTIGTAATVGGIVADIIMSNLTGEEAQRILRDDNIAYGQLKDAIDNVCSTWKKMSQVPIKGTSQMGKYLEKMPKEMNPLREVYRVVDELGRELGLGRIATYAVLITVVAIPLNLYGLLTGIRGNIPEVAKAIYNIVESLECPDRDVRNVLSHIEEHKALLSS